MQLLEDKEFHTIHKLSDLSAEYDAVFFDIWGVLHEGGDLYPGVRSVFNELRKKKIVRIISNAPRLRHTICNNLQKQGLEIEEHEIFTSGETTRNILRNPGNFFGMDEPLIYHVGGDRNLELIDSIDLKQTENLRDANLIILSSFRDYNESHTDIIHNMELAAAYQIPVLCANPDTEVLHLGQVRRCAGYFAQICEQLGGRVFFSGKPGEEIFKECKASFNHFGKKMLMIGDTFHTDIAGARNSSIDSALVLTGNMSLLLKSMKLENSIDSANHILSKQNILPNYLISVE